MTRVNSFVNEWARSARSRRIRFELDRNDTMASRSVHDSQSRARFCLPALKFYPATWPGIKYGIYGVRERIRHEGWGPSARVIHVDFKEHNTNQIGSGLPRSRISFSCQTFLRAGKAFGIFRSWQHPPRSHSSSTQHSKRERGIMQRGIMKVCSALLFLLCDDSRWYFNQTAFQRFSISPSASPREGKILRVRDQPRYAGENRIGEETRNLRSTLSDRSGTGWQKNQIPAC